MEKLIFICFFLSFSLTEGTSKGSQLAIKEGNTQKHTNREATLWSAGPKPQSLFHVHSFFT